MIDLHCHILPGLDDGPRTLNEALSMCQAAVADGIKVIVAAPHFKPGTYSFNGPGLLELVEVFNRAVQMEELDLTILPGAEIAVSPEMVSHLQDGRHLTINNQGRYFLTEFSPWSIPPDWEAFLLSFLSSDMVPIIAHPERNAWFIRHPDALASAVSQGILVQVTAMSITGGFGTEVQDFSLQLLKENLVQVIASDGHSAEYRPPVLRQAVLLAANIIGLERAEALVTTIPRAIIEARKIPPQEQTEYHPLNRGQNRNWFQRLFT
jgi:protein-tyrosine phosphatase